MPNKYTPESATGDVDQVTREAVRTLRIGHATVHDFSDWLASVLSSVAAELGSSDALVAGRPGSWEAAKVIELVKGTVGWDDEYLAQHRLS
jgi:hypothetical protein